MCGCSWNIFFLFPRALLFKVWQNLNRPGCRKHIVGEYGRGTLRVANYMYELHKYIYIHMLHVTYILAIPKYINILVQYIGRFYKVLFCICHVKSINCVLFNNKHIFGNIILYIVQMLYIYIVYIHKIYSNNVLYNPYE